MKAMKNHINKRVKFRQILKNILKFYSSINRMTCDKHSSDKHKEEVDIYPPKVVVAVVFLKMSRHLKTVDCLAYRKHKNQEK